MQNTIAVESSWLHAGAQQWRANLAWALWYCSLLCMTGVIGLLMLRMGPNPIPIGGIVGVAMVLAVLWRPRLGLYICAFFALLGDAVLIPWYPFVKNLSSAESILYMGSAMIFSPLEIFLALTALGWVGRGIIVRKFEFHTGVLFGPIVLFTVSIGLGLLYGLGTGGDLTIALWESRPIFYICLVMILTSNLIETRAHLNQLVWIIMAALFVEGLIGSDYFFNVLGGSLVGVEAITEHSAAIHMNTLFVFILTVWLFQASLPKRVLLPLMTLPVIITYLATQRRAAYLTLFIAIAFIVLALYKENRKLFWFIMPTIFVVMMGYIAVFWNSGSAIAMPVQAIRSVVAPSEGSADDLSNIYRILENANVSFTIHAAPLTGVGFGKKFFINVPMPDISFFVWWEYIVHNSIMWIWMKAGVLGFLSMLLLIGQSIMVGSKSTWRMPDPDTKAIALTATLYIIMHFTYAYVDMSWDAQSMLYLGLVIGMLNSLERIAAKPIPVESKRWPWQPDAVPAPVLILAEQNYE
ncbi:MAG: O-antigen ligase family protein [Caldilineaceae bacterium]